MRKSQIKQTLLSTFFGPPGLCYVSVKAALAATLASLMLILALKNYSLMVLLMSIPATVVYGALLVRWHNKKLVIKNFTPTNFIGQVSCRVVGKTAIKRDYHQLLAKARWKNRISAQANSVLAGLCIVVSAFIAIPNLTDQLAISSLEKNQPSASVNSSDSNASRNIKLFNNGRWQVETTPNMSASLKADAYQNSNNGRYRPTLTLACIDNKTSLRFTTAEILGTENTPVVVSFDGSAQNVKQWKTSADYQSAVAPAPIRLVKQFNQKSSVTLSFQPFGASQKKTATFKLSYSADTIKSIRKKCSW